MHRSSFLLVALAGCGFTPGEVSLRGDATGDGVSVTDDAGTDAVISATNCYDRWHDHTIQFDTPVTLENVKSSQWDRDPFLSPDERTLWFSSGRNSSTTDVFVAKRASIADDFVTVANATEFDDTSANESKVSMTADGLYAVIGSNREDSSSIDVWAASRASIADPWSEFMPVAAVSTDGPDHDPTVSADGLTLYLAPGGQGPQFLAVSTRKDRNAAFGPPSPIAELNSDMGDADPSPTPDGRIIVFSSHRTAAGFGGGNVWYATRDTTSSDAWSAPQIVPGINTDMNEGDPHLSVDGCRIYFSRAVAGDDWDLFVATAQP